jgi:hypothetical protein
MSVGVMKDYKLKTKEFTRLPYTGLVLELEHLKIVGLFIMLTHWVGRGTGRPKDKDSGLRSLL